MALGPQPGEYLDRDSAEYFLRALTSEPLHIRTKLVAQFGVIDDNAFLFPLDNLSIELKGLTQDSFVLPVLANVA